MENYYNIKDQYKRPIANFLLTGLMTLAFNQLKSGLGYSIFNEGKYIIIIITANLWSLAEKVRNILSTRF